ncbi:hypothetical protein EC973_007432 [Apophysomyces ossiformis]|uniref:Peptide hydrolase n=1 Tax=Apophysomyces ossiformis TaxID=679940 RepID=A0A8H7BXW0_9FUNG|nr:hypothetical protein EC973_007432 [Apophysomyces ossiformis]
MENTNGSLSERTPLLSTSPSRNTQSAQSHNKRSWPIYSLLAGFLVILVCSVYSVRNKLPRPLSDAQARASNGFAGIHSYNEYLYKFQAPHPATTRENAAMQSWLIELAKDFQAQGAKKNLSIEIVTDDPTRLVAKRDRFASNEYWMVESRNVMLRIIGQTNKTDEALLINAHYDSVGTSPGVTDNGMGVAVALELVRYLIDHPPKHTVMFLFNNFEEGEGTGAGGRALLFRSDNLGIIQTLGSNAHLVHASVLGDSLLKSRVIRSDTDYTLFVKDGVPGMDLAFYTPRAFYHTQRDDLVHTTPSALQHMGQMALATVQGLDRMDAIPTGQQNTVYYDILGRILVVCSFTTFQIINMVALVTVPILAIAWTLTKSANGLHCKEKIRLLGERSLKVFQGFIAVILALLCILVTTGLAAVIMTWIHPSFSYGNAYEAGIFLVVAAFFGLLLSQILGDKLVTRKSTWDSIARFDAQYYGLVIAWWILVAVSTYYASHEEAGLYYAVYFLGSSTVAAFLYVLLPDTDHLRLSVVFVVQTLIPFVLMTELGLLTMDGLRHTSADGVPELTIYYYMAIPIVFLVLHFLPWVRVAGQHRKAASTTGVLLGFFFIMCVFLSVFNAGSPNRILFNQYYNVTEPTVNVSLVTETGLQDLLEQSLPSNEADTIHCEPAGDQTRCTYATDLVPLYARHPGKEVNVRTQTACHATQCRTNITAIVQNSVLCQLRLDHQIQRAWVNGELIDGDIEALMLYSRTFGKPMHWGIEYGRGSFSSLKPSFSCIYDEWTHGELPAFTTLRNSLPETALVSIRGGVGLATVHYGPVNLTLY